MGHGAAILRLVFGHPVLGQDLGQMNSLSCQPPLVQKEHCHDARRCRQGQESSKILVNFFAKKLARAGGAARAMIAAGDHCQDLISSS
jgi:hypothetical protein